MTDEMIKSIERVALDAIGGIVIVAILFAFYLAYKVYFTGRNGG